MLRETRLFARIHLNRYFRIISQLGIFRVIFLIVVIALIFKATLRPAMLQWQALAVIAVVAQAHFYRKDFVLLNNLGLNKPGFFMLLFTLFLSPFILLYLIWPDYPALMILLVGSGLISIFVRPMRRTWKFTLPAFRFLPADAWEWRVGLRRSLPVLILAYAIPAVFFRYDYLFAASIIVLSITANTFQQHHEPLTMFEALKTTPNSYFWRKIFLQCSLLAVLILPLMLASILLYPDGIRPVILIFFNSIVVQAFAVSLKYAGYLPGSSSPYHSSILVLLNFAFIIPAMLPIPFIMTLVFGRKALNQLNLVAG
jgi:hypothetical protein